MIKAKIIADSINPSGIRLTTFEITYNRFIHSELMTHRAFSRNAASSRAIPIKKMIMDVIRNPATPEFWGANQKGMQSSTELGKWRKSLAQVIWKQSRWLAVAAAWTLNAIGAHKQIPNRILEPWSHITVICTSTYYNNFFALRAHPMAQPEFQVLAYRMLDVYLKSKPQKLEWGSWHLPYIDGRDWPQAPDEVYPYLCKISAARCARVSYLTQDGKRDHDKDLELYTRLVGQIPLHASALEHVAQATNLKNYSIVIPNSNFHPSWKQLRKNVPSENITEIDLPNTLDQKPDWITL